MPLFFMVGAAAIVLVLGAVALLALVLKLVFWFVFLPIRLLFALLAGLAGLLVTIVAAPLALAAVIVAAVVALALVVVPLLPLALVGLIGWALYRAFSRQPSHAI
jgi:hypothetical protein